MAEITAALVKELRDKTGAGMMDCKKALSETGGNVEEAIDWLRTKGLAQAQKKAGRVAAEGLIGVAVDGARGAVVEVNAETDFVARNESFQAFVAAVANLTLEAQGDVDKLKGLDYPGSGRTVEEELTHLIATIGENMTIRRAGYLEVSEGALAHYVHNQLGDGIGKIGVLVALEGTGSADTLANFGKQVAMHVAAAKPESIGRDDLPAEAVERERQILIEQARDSGKPENIIEKMVEGRLRKYYEEACLLEQVFVIDGENTVQKALDAANKEAGGEAKIKGFKLFVLGEGIEKKEEDFAAEVQAAMGG